MESFLQRRLIDKYGTDEPIGWVVGIFRDHGYFPIALYLSESALQGFLNVPVCQNSYISVRFNQEHELSFDELSKIAGEINGLCAFLQ